MSALLSSVVPVAFIVAVGYLVGRRLELDLRTLSRFSIYVLASSLIFDSMYSAELKVHAAFGILAGFTITSVLLYLGVRLLVSLGRLRRPAGASLMATTLFANSGNMGLSVVFFTLGQAGLDRAIVYFIASSMLMFGFGPVLFRGGGWRESLRFILTLPLIWAMVLGLAFRLLHIQLPYNLDSAIHMMGQAVIPVVLLILGMQIAQSRFHLGAFEAVGSTLRLLAAPVLAFLVGRLLGLSSLDLKVLVLQSAMPAAVNSFLLAAEFGGDSARTARVVVSSTVLAFISLPAVLWLLRAG